MHKKVKFRNRFGKKGFGLIEILIVGAIIGIGFLAIISFLIFSRGVSFQITRNTEATSLAEEGMEVVRKLRDADTGWTANIATKTSGTNYYPVISSGNWTLSTSNPGLINNLYTRTVVFADVYRNNGDIGSGTLDPDTKKLTVTVSWQEAGRSKQVVLTTYITNFLNN